MDYKYIKTEYLEMVSGGDCELIRELINMFRDQVVEIHYEMQSLLSAKSFYSLGLLAHKAKSSVAIMGMDDLAEMLKTLESKAKEGKDLSHFESYIARFGSETKAAIAELDDFVNN